MSEEFWSSRDVRQPHNPPLWMRAIYAKQELVPNPDAWTLNPRLRPIGWHQTGVNYQTGSWTQ